MPSIFTGRGEELKRFNELLEREKGILLVVGESGIGKTELINEFSRRLKDKKEVFAGLYECQFTEEGKGPYLAVLGRLVGDAESKLEQSTLKKAFGMIGQAFKVMIDRRGELGKAVVKDLWEVLRAREGMGDNTLKLFGKVWKETKNAKLGISLLGEELKKYQQPFIQTYFDIFQALKEGFSEKKFILMLDQFERADITSQNLLLDFARGIPENVFLIVSFKVEEHVKPGEKDTFLKKYEDVKLDLMKAGAEMMELGGLSWEEIGEWIEIKWDKRLVKPELIRIEKASGGLPLILEEWLESPILDVNDLGRTQENMNEYFKARINALDPKTRDFAYRLSVLLAPLRLEDYSRLLRLGGREIKDWECQGMLEELEQHLVFKRNGAHWFRHEKVKDFTEEYMGTELREKYHRAAIKFFQEEAEKHSKEGKIPFSIGLALAFNSYKAGMWGEAYQYNESLAEFALHTGSLDVAEGCYLRAAEAAEKLRNKDRKIVSLGNLAALYSIWGRKQEAYNAYDNVLSYARKVGHRRQEAIALLHLGLIRRDQGEYKEAEEFQWQSLTIAEQLSDKSTITSNLNELGVIYQDQGRYLEAENLYRRSLKIAEEVEDKSGIARALHNLGNIKQFQGNYPEAENLYRQSLKIKEELAYKIGIGITLHQLGVLYHRWGDYQEAERLYQQSLIIRKEVGDKRGIASTLNQLGGIKQLQGDYSEAEKLYRQSLIIERELNNKSGIARTVFNLGRLHEEKGEYQEALDKYLAARDIFHQLRSPYEKQVLEGIERIKERLSVHG